MSEQGSWERWAPGFPAFQSPVENAQMKRRKSAFWRGVLPGAALAAVMALSGQMAQAAGTFTNGVCTAGSTGTSTGTPAVTYCNNSNTYPLTGNETIPADTQLSGGQSPQSEAILTRQLAQFGSSQLTGNVLIGGDAGTNLWQRATTGASQTTTVAYGGPDRWAYWSGTNTAVTVSRSNTAAALPVGYQQSFRMQRTAAQTGVVQVCMAQEVESANALQLAGQTVELDFHAFTGANFSAASQQMKAYIIYGTGTDEGMTNMAFGLNGGGGGATGWTGQTNIGETIGLQAVSTLGKYAAVAKIPATATEVGVALCYTPVGTAGTTDALYFSGIQLVPNANLTSVALSASGNGFSCDNTANTQLQCSAFQRRSQALESLLQYRYYYQISEGATVLDRGVCRSRSVTTCSWNIQFPTVMRIAPTVTYTAGFAVETTVGGGTLNACSALANDATVTGATPSTTNAYALCTATTVPAAGTVDQVYDNNGSGAVKATAEL